MKIVQAVGWYFPESLGGSEIYVAGLSQRLQAAGHEVLIAAPFTVDDPAKSAEKFYEHDGVPVFRYPIPATPSSAECQGRVVVRGAERLHAWLSAQRPDVIHLHSFVTSLGLAELKVAKTLGARVIVTSHTSGLGFLCQRGSMMQWGEALCNGLCRPAKCAACELQHRGLSKPMAQALGSLPVAISGFGRVLPGKLGTAIAMSHQIARNQYMQRDLLAAADKFVLLTEWALEAVASNGASREKLALNRLGLSHRQSVRKPTPTEAPTTPPLKVGYLGRFEPIKGALDLARAIAILDPATPISFEFRGPVKSEAEQAVVREIQTLLRDHPRFQMAPAVKADEVPAVLAGYDLLCCPSRCLEGGPTVAIEAHAAGTPVIGTAIGGLAELVTDGVNGRLVKPGDWRALAEVLRQVADNPRGTIDHWRLKLPVARTMDQIALDYLALYGGRDC